MTIGRDHFSFIALDWQAYRKNVNTVFNPSVLKTFVPTLNRRFLSLARNLERFVDQPEFDFTEHILGCSFNSVLGKFDHFQALNLLNKIIFFFNQIRIFDTTMRN